MKSKIPQEVVALYLDCSPWTLARMRCDQSSLPFRKLEDVFHIKEGRFEV